MEIEAVAHRVDRLLSEIENISGDTLPCSVKAEAEELLPLLQNTAVDTDRARAIVAGARMGLGHACLCADGLVKWRLVSDATIASLRMLLAHGGISAQTGKIFLPILIAARNEERFIRRTLESVREAVRHYGANGGTAVPIICLADNGSTDRTISAVTAFQAAAEDEVEVIILSVDKPGKSFALRRLLDLVDEIHATKGTVGRIVFLDAEITWQADTLLCLENFLDKNPNLDIAGANIRPRPDQERTPPLWGAVEFLAYYGYGSQKAFIRFASGMTWMGNKVPCSDYVRSAPPFANDDIAVCFQAGAEKVGIARLAVARFSISTTWAQFYAIRIRQTRRLFGLFSAFCEQDYSCALQALPMGIRNARSPTAGAMKKMMYARSAAKTRERLEKLIDTAIISNYFKPRMDAACHAGWRHRISSMPIFDFQELGLGIGLFKMLAIALVGSLAYRHIERTAARQFSQGEFQANWHPVR